MSMRLDVPILKYLSEDDMQLLVEKLSVGVRTTTNLSDMFKNCSLCDPTEAGGLDGLPV